VSECASLSLSPSLSLAFSLTGTGRDMDTDIDTHSVACAHVKREREREACRTRQERERERGVSGSEREACGKGVSLPPYSFRQEIWREDSFPQHAGKMCSLRVHYWKRKNCISGGQQKGFKRFGWWGGRRTPTGGGGLALVASWSQVH